MARVFISYVEEDSAIARALAFGLEAVGYSTWYYERDSVPGVDYLRQTGDAIDQANAFLLVISPDSIQSHQVTSEVVRAHEGGKPFVPVLRDLTHVEFQRLKPVWRQAVGAATSVRLSEEGVHLVLPRLIAGLQQLLGSAGPPAAGVQPSLPTPSSPPQVPQAAWTTCGDLDVRMACTFERAAYEAGEDPVAWGLLECEVRSRGTAGVGADLFLCLDGSGSMDQPDRYPLLRQAVGRLLAGVRSDDRVGIALFSTDADVVLAPISGGDAARDADRILGRMDGSHLLFGGETRLAPALAAARQALAASARTAGVQRVYVLTDGELHDADACRDALRAFRQAGLEVHVYGFGSDFDAAALKRLVSDQLGGSVKPICNEQDIVDTFAHVAAVTKRLVARGGMLTVDFSLGMTCGDGWAFRPQERHLGPIKGRRLLRELGGLEAGRVYSLAFEVRLPPDAAPITPIASVQLAWQGPGGRVEHRLPVDVRRASGASTAPAEPRVLQARAILEGLRQASNPEAQIAALKARRDLAILEGREPRLIAALQKQIEVLEGRAPVSSIDEEIRQYLNSDQDTKEVKSPEQELERCTSLRARAVAEGASPEYLARLDQEIEQGRNLLDMWQQRTPPS